DMPWTDYTLDDEFRQWIVDFPTQQLPVINSLLSEYRQKARIVVFHTREEADAFIASMTQ
ncbi:MAG: hypothetical protein K2H99_01280, partial [Paramuribaculum sp.]|nr:hypothetical protein [Paramuribaculum sp.]